VVFPTNSLTRALLDLVAEFSTAAAKDSTARRREVLKNMQKSSSLFLLCVGLMLAFLQAKQRHLSHTCNQTDPIQCNI
jgi:ferric iron reductase protein FhuF